MEPRAVLKGMAGVLLVAGLAAGCAPRTMSIKALLDDPGRYDRKTVRIRGTVEAPLGVLSYGAYRVNDDTGVLTVITNTGGTPREGTRVEVRGEFRIGFTLGTETVATLIEDERTAP